jgi:hypothetical protein
VWGMYSELIRAMRRGLGRAVGAGGTGKGREDKAGGQERRGLGEEGREPVPNLIAFEHSVKGFLKVRRTIKENTVVSISRSGSGTSVNLFVHVVFKRH